MRFPAPDGQQFKFEELVASDIQLLGRATYAAAWPAMEETTGEFGERMNGMPKVVVSTTLTEPTWKNTTVISEDVADEMSARMCFYSSTGPSAPPTERSAQQVGDRADARSDG